VLPLLLGMGLIHASSFFFFFFFFWFFIVSMNFSSYEDWGVDELIVEDSWKRQVGGD
jgi:hypothetical protein